NQAVVSLLITSSSKLWSASKDGTIKIWNIKTGDQVKEISKPNTSGKCASFVEIIKVGKKVWSTSADLTIRVWDVKHFTLLKEIRTDNFTTALCHHKDTVWVGSAGPITIFNANNFRKISQCEGHRKMVNSIIS